MRTAERVGESSDATKRVEVGGAGKGDLGAMREGPIADDESAALDALLAPDTVWLGG